jgi:hypothetical protein
VRRCRGQADDARKSKCTAPLQRSLWIELEEPTIVTQGSSEVRGHLSNRDNAAAFRNLGLCCSIPYQADSRQAQHDQHVQALRFGSSVLRL